MTPQGTFVCAMPKRDKPQPPRLPLGRWLSWFGLVLAALFLMLPILVIVPLSFGNQRYLAFPDGDWSLRHYATLFDGAWLLSILQSLGLALLVGALATALAFLFATGIWLQRRYRTLLTAIVLLPMIVPQVVSAMSIYYLDARLGILDSLLGVGFGHLLMALPYSVIAMLVAYARLDLSLYKASRSLGAGLWPTLWSVLLPNVRGGLLGSFFMGFVMSWEEVVVTLFTSGLSVVTLPKRIWDGLRYNLDPAIAAVSTLMIVLTLAVMLLRMYFERRRPPA
ncbi:ABC transporter permease [Pseudomonas sp. ZM23]|uniref:ABC transporter permease n=1 Tax=Pseudomonas triclosanedens TaxID=2961893 RepID=A0ABY6ZQK4_9PSED|nr:ABC transporter permease [Pseudomonas triclosanedens]MCP8466175.1 ABC transporter permease [Pseudomonas triclosanedens]MCP8472410.1 ABC transporter permease [Pseudomonas triclosanedens]MCP8477474.1 ABC transporter permease [Pseudomonas triclosanedens]WAI47194.1 ABC transporter permease [Pseudomonas triclosanedens]